MPRNWDEHYSDPGHLDFTPAPLVVEVADLVPPGRALDLACGAGRNALHLAALGWHITAVDSSPAAIRVLRGRAAGLPIDAQIADLEAGQFRIAPAAYDLILDFYYLQHDLFPAIREGVRPGGIFAAAIHLCDDSPDARPRNPAYVLQPGELRRQFADWRILYYSESANPPHRLSARLLARRA
jgi:tellurite methyltransferase